MDLCLSGSFGILIILIEAVSALFAYCLRYALNILNSVSVCVSKILHGRIARSSTFQLMKQNKNYMFQVPCQIRYFLLNTKPERGMLKYKKAQASFHQAPTCKISYLSNNQFADIKSILMF